MKKDVYVDILNGYLQEQPDLIRFESTVRAQGPWWTIWLETRVVGLDPLDQIASFVAVCSGNEVGQELLSFLRMLREVHLVCRGGLESEKDVDAFRAVWASIPDCGCYSAFIRLLLEQLRKFVAQGDVPEKVRVRAFAVREHVERLLLFMGPVD